MVVHVYNPELQKLRQEDGQFQALFQKDKKKKWPQIVVCAFTPEPRR